MTNERTNQPTETDSTRLINRIAVSMSWIVTWQYFSVGCFFCTDLDKHRRKAKPVRATPKSGEIFCWRKRKTLNIYFGISACRGRSSFFAFCAFSRFARFRELRKCLMNAFAWPGELCFIQSEDGECFSWWSIFMLRHRLKNIIVDYVVRCSISVGLVLGLGSQDRPGGGSRTSH